MRSSSTQLFAVFLPLALVAGTALGACGSQADALFVGGQASEEPTTSSSGGTTFGTADAGSGTIPARGSPLCAVVAGQCTPDDDGSKALSYGALACATPAPDAGTPDAHAGPGCRLTRSEGAPKGSAGAPQCLDADRRGLDGTSCSKGQDCAPGFDCVDGEKGAVCRRYCCSGSCENHTSQNAGPTFCDVQKLVETIGLQAPVCMPLKTCKLLVEGQCDTQETCAVVTDKGDTGCVPTGNATVGAACDQEHCAAALTCLGNLGDRRCYKLCKTEGSNCGSTQTCTTGTVFTDPTFGVCRDE